jgi:hypothetical protein
VVLSGKLGGCLLRRSYSFLAAEEVGGFSLLTTRRGMVGGDGLEPPTLSV